MPWFRKRQRNEEKAPIEAAAPEAPALEEPDSPADAPPVEGAETKPRPRRRGTRGGRGRTKKPAAAVAEATPADKGTQAAEKPKPRPRRPRQAPKRPTLPPLKKEILVSIDVGEQRVAVLEDGKPAEVYLERRGRRSIAGNVYKGVVDNVLPGMEASFVDIGLEKNGFLYVDEIVVPELEGRRGSRRIQELIERGQEVLVQAVKDPMGTKGARLTTEISLPGRFLVLVPFGEGIGVSRRLEDAERDRLKEICKALELPEGGIIVRTAAEGASRAELEGDLAFLRKLWATIQGRAARAEAPALVYQEAEIPLRIVRDLFIRDFERVVVDHERTHRRIVGYLKRTSPELAARVELYQDAEPLMEASGVEQAVRSTLSRRVDLPSGGYLIFDYAEAFTVIDVNTGRFVGARGKGSGARLEDTITKNNLEAVSEVVRQLRLRDIGGIIVIDFIDMANPKNRELVEEALKTELERDRTKTYVVEISPLGLVEMTRQNVTDGPREILTHRCPVCSGDGIVLSSETHAIDIERKLRRLGATSPSEGFLVELNPTVAGILIGPGGSRLSELEAETGRRFAFEAKEGLEPDHLRVLAEGAAEEIEEKGLPVVRGQELMLKLEEPHMHNEGDAIARVDGYVISVAGAASKVGKRMKIRIERATRTSAYAVLTSARPLERPVEAADLAELEVEVKPRPRRRPPAKKNVEEALPEAAPEESAEPEPAAVEAPAAGGAEERPVAPRRKTRRGSRGGRGRTKKKVVEGVAPEVVVEAPPEPEQEPDASAEAEPSSPKTDDAAERPKRKTRRGSRGGRNRRRRTPVADGAKGAEAPVTAFAAEEEPG